MSQSNEESKAKKESKEYLELFGAKITVEDLVKMLLDPSALRMVEQHQRYMFPRGNIDEKTRLTDGEILAGSYIKCAKQWFPRSLGHLLDYFLEIEELAVSRDGLGRKEGVDLLTMRRALKQVATQLRGGVTEEKGRKGKAKEGELEDEEY